MTFRGEIGRIRAEYEARASNPQLARRYAALNPAALLAIQSRERALFNLLRAEGIFSLSSLRILDVGTGSGAELRRFLGYGAQPELLHGFDLLEERLSAARRMSPNLNFVNGDAAHLPYADNSFDIVTQYTVFSSILDQGLRKQIANEMIRVLSQTGLIVWYDFWLNPGNRATRGIRPLEVRRLFPTCTYRVRRVTLAPPIARAIAPKTMLGAEILELLPFLRSHYLIGIREKLDQAGVTES